AIARELSRPDAAVGFEARPAVAVLRFSARDVHPDTRLFAEGLVEDLITLFSKWRGFPVIAKSASAYCDVDLPASDIGRAIGAAYLISGSVLSRKGTLRITARLEEARRQWCLWSDTFERPA